MEVGGLVGQGATHYGSYGPISYPALLGRVIVSGTPVLRNTSRAGGLHTAIPPTTPKYLIETIPRGVALLDYNNADSSNSFGRRQRMPPIRFKKEMPA
jgi:hypothetical protein